MRRRGFGYGEIAHPRLDARDAGDRVDLQDPVQLRERQHDAVGARHRAAGQAGSGAARDDGYAQLVAGAQDPYDLIFGLRQRDRQRRLPESGQSVAVERHGLLGPRQHAISRKYLGEGVEQTAAAVR